MNKNLKKVASAATVPCKYRGTGIECPKSEFHRNICGTCGWNPLVEATRKKEISHGRP